eukprot:5239166-Pleurochrysis_carterae.AAC.3
MNCRARLPKPRKRCLLNVLALRARRERCLLSMRGAFVTCAQAAAKVDSNLLPCGATFGGQVS